MKKVQTIDLRQLIRLGAGQDAQGVFSMQLNWNDDALPESPLYGLRVSKFDVSVLLNELTATEATPVIAPDLLRLMCDTDGAAVLAFTTSGLLPVSVYDKKAMAYWQRSGSEYIETRTGSVYNSRRAVDSEFMQLGSFPRRGRGISLGFDYDNSSLGIDVIVDFTVDRYQLTPDESLRLGLAV